jgi:hypothetical protein
MNRHVEQTNKTTVFVFHTTGTTYNAMQGFGFGGGIGDTFRDYRQDDEISRERAELEAQRLKNAELEQRLAQLERAGQVPPQVLQSAPVPVQSQQQP